MDSTNQQRPGQAGAAPRELLAGILARGGEEAEFQARLGFRFEAIARLAAGLYGGGEDGAAALIHRITALLEESWRARPADLKAADRERERRRAAGLGPWYLEPGLAAYMLYLDRFSGDLAGLASRIGYLEELGVNLVHLMPFFPSPAGNNDGGYAVSDYLGVDPRLGTTAELEAAARLLHGRGMYLAADLVLNHCSDEHPWALAAKAGDPEAMRRFYIYPDRATPDRFESAMPQVFPETAPGNFTWVPGMRSWVMTVFHDFQWDLNWSNPGLFLEMLAVLLGMANRGIDLIRLDAVPYLWKEAGTSCQNLPEAHDIVRLLKACADVVAPGVAFLAEAIVQPAEIVRYLDSGGVEECQLAYHASLMVLLWDALATRKTGILSRSFGEETRLAPGTAWLSYARCHDDIGLGFDEEKILRAGFSPPAHRRFLLDFYAGRFPGSFARGRLFMENPATGDARISGTCASLCGLEAALALEPGAAGPAIELAVRRIELLYGLVCSLVGIPLVFSGDELGLRNDYSWEGDPHLAEDNRWMHRPPLDGEAAARRAEPGSLEKRIFGWIAGCLRRRREIAAFAPDAPFEVLPSREENLFLCLRRPRPGAGAEARPVLVVANFAPESRFLPGEELPPRIGTPGRELLGGSAARRGTAPGWELPAYGLLWLELG